LLPWRVIIAAMACNHCCHGRATKRSLFIAVGVGLAANNIEEFGVAMEMQQ